MSVSEGGSRGTQSPPGRTGISMSVAISSKPSAPRVAAILGGQTPPPVHQITVGEYYRNQADRNLQSGLNAIGTGIHFTVEAIPGVILAEMASIRASHRYAAYQRVYGLPWDSQGQWKVKADQILAEESKKADAEIRNLPMVRAMVSTGQAIVTGATAVGTAVVDGASWVANTTVDGVSAVGNAIYDGGAYVADQSVKTYKAAGRGFLGWLATLGQSLFNWANGAKPAFAN